MRRQILLRGLEMRGLDVRSSCVAIAKRLDQHGGVRVVKAAGPVEPQAARFTAGGLGEASDDLGPPVGRFRADPELRGYEDHLTPRDSSRSSFIVECP